MNTISKHEKRSEDAPEHARRLTNKEHEPVSESSNRIQFNTEFYDAVFGMIPDGRRNAVSMMSLSALIQVDTRTCRKIVSNMRERGYLIVGDSHGYYKPASNKELSDWYDSVKRRAISSLNSLKYARKVINGNGVAPPVIDLEHTNDRKESKQ